MNALTSCHISAASSNLEQFFNLSLPFVTLMEKNAGRLLPGMSLSVPLSDVSLMMRFRFCIFGRSQVFFSVHLLRRHNAWIPPISQYIYLF